MKIIVGLLLLLAGCLKTLGFYSDSVVLEQPEWVQAILPFEIAAEFVIGLVALWGIYWQHVRWVAINLFAGFAAYSLYLTLQGIESCGCFGPVKVNPWWTFGLDLVVVAGLLAEWCFERRSRQPRKDVLPIATGPGVLGKLVAIGCVSVFLLIILLWQSRPVVHANGMLQTVSGLTILEPTEWTGQPFPLTESLGMTQK